MGILRGRKQLLAIRNMLDLQICANKQSQRKLQKIINKGVVCSCPLCKLNEFVIKNGSKDGIPKYICKNHDRPFHFLVSGSYEAIEIYRETMIKFLSQFVSFNASTRGATLYNEMSKYFVEFSLEQFNDFILKKSGHTEKMVLTMGTVIIFFDIAGCALTKNKAIILAKINGDFVFDVVSTSNYLTTHQFLAKIKEKFNIEANQTVIFVTDGETCFVDSIRNFFPNAIHIRQFHKKSCKGIVYMHLRHYNKLYTIRVLWDVVLNEGEASEHTKRMREYKAKRKLEGQQNEKKELYSELSKNVMIWEGTVYLPRGYRKKLNKKIQKNKESKKNKPSITTRTDTPKQIFKGDLEGAMEFGVMKRCYKYLKKVFGGRYITSNIIETAFNIKSMLYPHRTMKFGNRILVCVLYSQFVLKNKSKEELRRFFRENVITYEFLMEKVLYGTGEQKKRKNAVKDKMQIFLTKIRLAIKFGMKLVLHYCDRNKKHTARIIKPERLEINEYDGLYSLYAYCEKREDKRTFLLDRIRDMDFFNPKPCYVISPPYG